MSWYEEIKAEHYSSRHLGLGDTGYYDQDSGAWGGHNPVSGPLLLLASWLSSAGLFLAGLAIFGAQLHWDLGSLPPLPREFKPLYLLCPLSSHCPLEDGAHGHIRTSARHFNRPSLSSSCASRSQFCSKQQSGQAHGTNLASLTVLCPFSRFSLSRLPCSSRWPLIQSQAMKYKEKSVEWRGSWGDIWKSFCSFIKGTGIKGEFF